MVRSILQSKVWRRIHYTAEKMKHCYCTQYFAVKSLAVYTLHCWKDDAPLLSLPQSRLVEKERGTAYNTTVWSSCNVRILILPKTEVDREKVQHATVERRIWIMRHNYLKDLSEDVQSCMGYCHIAKFVASRTHMRTIQRLDQQRSPVWRDGRRGCW
jgi:hypothetical protein